MTSGFGQDELGDIEVYSSPTILEPDDDQVAQISFSWLNAVLLIFFGISSWVAINGLWMELPLLVYVLPEGWNLPAYLSIIIQLANIGPLVYILLTRICRTFGRGQSSNWCMRLIQPPERLANYTILVVGLTASLLLTQFWNAVVLMPGLPANAVLGGGSVTPEALYGHSLGLFVLTFALGMIDCMSSVTFLAYLANMPAVYAGALLFGETASGLLPSLYALGQGVNTEAICVPSVNENGTIEYHPVNSPPNFGVSTFMALIAGTTGVSLLAFGLLDCLPTALGRSVTLAYQRLHSLPPASNVENVAGSCEDQTKSITPESVVEMTVETHDMTVNGLYWVCFLLTGYSSCLTNGLLPSLQSFSTAAYSTRTFHLAVTLSGITGPIVAVVVTAFYGYDQLGLWIRSVLRRLCFCTHTQPLMEDWNSPEVDNQQTLRHPTSMASIEGGRLALILTFLGVIGSFFAGYIIFLAAASPSPPQLGGAGSAFSVLSWVLMTAALSIQKTWITLYLVKYGSQRNLRTLGTANQIGSATGALISFLLTAKFNVFVPKAPCP
ncbi:Solute carrier family 52 riboflavin transporter member 3-A [Taenia crassiceps]|uniref:Riboflavin transporter n=1 Tax=Taenia crassiceps TaxID=6207 RepID=A0ABR4Q7V5_9CEST